MATTTARPPALLSAVLLIYPATLLLGSLFSTISPTARHSRDLFVSSPHPASPLAPSLAADMHLSEGPVNYFARKNNVFNIYFVKIGWLWTTAAFVSLLITQPVFSSSLRESSSQQEARFRRTLQAILRYALTTTVWYLATQWFFGPAIIDRGFVATGGKCERALEEAGKMTAGQGSSANLETLFTAATCKSAGGAWSGGHDISGHVLMLVLATGFLAFEAVGASAPACLSRFSSTGDAGRERKTSDADSTPVIDSTETGGFARTWSLRLVWGVVGLGWWMLFMTAIWFHTWLEKWSGLSIALSSVYAIYILPRRIPALRDVIGLPGV
ncbi:Fat storage-inducing transmembrane protein [Penicillium griseofulvum]|uniref:Acyl-coenzyme A diphosphatase SCS3 n=1 Tax=Penicillium patulum TaxID=5078 RepID=A0A135L8G9_PENPA|nr:Fat storage-inducing transmembrane protein [Penicillium griseofulvum]KXG45256.1 Fat storage-inducing transmembrane protein [Penicillium griseofulvum]